MFILYLLFALLAGIAVSSQSAINTQLAKAMSGEPIIAALISFTVGTIILLLISLFKTDLSTNLANLPQQPIWKLLGGVLGAGFVFTTILLAPKIGITNMLFFVIIGQLSAAVLIDHFGLISMPVREISLNKLLGLGVVGLGLIVFFFGDKFATLWK